MSRRVLLLLALCCAPGWAAVPAARAQLYRWTNEQGEVHFTQGQGSIPERFRPGAVLVGHPELPLGPPVAGRAEADPGRGVLARIPFVPGAPIVVTARVNGGRNVSLLLDTGASRTMIAPRTLSALGVDLRGTRPARVMGVTGSAEAVYVMLESLEVGQARVGPIEVLAHHPNMPLGEGLLGRDFLERFNLNIDTRERHVVLSRR